MNAGGPDDGFRGTDTPTPPTGVPDSADAPTPPTGFEAVSGVVGPEDFGRPSPAVLGETPPPESGGGDAGDWPTLEYRSRNRQEQRPGAFGWLRRTRDSE